MVSDTHVLIIGAGLTGLSTAHHLADRHNFRIIEKLSTVGGKANTVRNGQFMFDQTGHLLHLRDSEIKKWILPLMGKDLQLINRISRVWSDGVYTKYPYQSNTYGLPPEIARECLSSFFQNLIHRKKTSIKTFEDFIYHHFGSGFAKHFLLPYNEKIWGVHPREMTAAWCQRFVPIPTVDSVIEGVLGGQKQELGYNASFYYPKKGIGELSSTIADTVNKKQKIELDTSAVSIDYRKHLVTLSTGEKVSYHHLVSTMPLKELVGKLINPPKKIKAMAALLRAKPLYYLDIVIKTPKSPFFQWCYVPSPKIPFYRIGVYSNFSAHGLPSHYSTLYVELAARSKPNPKTIRSKIVKHLIEMGVIHNDSDIKEIFERYIECAYVIYDHNYEKIVPQLHAFLKKQKINSIGRYGKWEYSAMEDALIQGKNMAAELNK